jgi:hypothetical protein
MGFAQSHDGTISVPFDDVADGFIEHRPAAIVLCWVWLTFSCHVLFSKYQCIGLNFVF